MTNIQITAHRGKALGIVIAMTASLAAFSPSVASPSLNSPADIKAIGDLETSLNNQIDMKKATQYYAFDAIVYDIPSPGIYHGTKQIYEGFAPQFAPIKDQKLSFPDYNVISDGVMACVAFRIQNRVTYKSGGVASYSYRDIDALRKIDGKWKIIQQQLSFPVDLKTGMTVMNAPIRSDAPLNWGDDTIQVPAVDPAQAKAEILQWTVAHANTLDAEKTGQFYGPDDNAMIYNVQYSDDLRGLQKIKDYYRSAHANFKSIKSNVTQFYVDSDGILGAVIDQQTLEVSGRDGSKKFATIRQSDCLHRVNNKWYAVFEMNSFPVDIKTGKAVLGSGSPVSQH